MRSPKTLQAIVEKMSREREDLQAKLAAAEAERNALEVVRAAGLDSFALAVEAATRHKQRADALAALVTELRDFDWKCALRSFGPSELARFRRMHDQVFKLVPLPHSMPEVKE